MYEFKILRWPHLVLEVRQEGTGHLRGLARVLEQVVKVVESVQGGITVRGIASCLHMHEALPEIGKIWYNCLQPNRVFQVVRLR